MKFSEQWLRESVNPAANTQALAAQLTLAGLEVDSITPVAGTFTHVVVGEVMAVEPHPNAEKLKVCAVNVGEAAPLQIVCGAANVAKGLKVPCAREGAELPGGIKIKKAELRGVESCGMLCSAKELGIAESADGLMVLPIDATVGANIRSVLHLDDIIFELGLTPNRSDCLSIAGIAREVGVLNRMPVIAQKIDPVAAKITDQISIEIQAPVDCPRYLGRVIKGVNAKATSPIWLRERLRRSGLRSISAVVDVTNLVMFELGQPMHAFDLNKLRGGIVVRRARPNEKIRLLDEREISLTPETLVIADHDAAQAMAGVMGGAAAAVTDATRDILLECAFFAPSAVAGRARAYGMHTDSSHRFERGVDPEIQRQVIERATALILELAGGQPGPVTEAVHAEHLPARTPIKLRRARITRILGIAIPDSEVQDILVRLGLQVETTADGWLATPPSYRFDITLEVDLLEELARVYGYGKIPDHRPRTSLMMRAVPDAAVALDDVRETLLSRGYQEVITYSFVDPKLQQMLDPNRTPLVLANPIASDMSAMRTSLWPGLIKTLQHNLNRQQERVRIFESGLRFVRDAGVTQQDTVVGGLAYGPVAPEQWGEPRRVVDFFDIKADVEQLLQSGGGLDAFAFEPAEHPALHPGRSAVIKREGRVVGWVGELHPSVSKQLDLAPAPYVFEIEYAAITQSAARRFQEISALPSVRRDIAVVIDDAIAYSAVDRCVCDAAPTWLTQLQLFDVYRGKGVESGRKSLALGLTFQTLDRTLGDADVDAAVQKIVAILEQRLGAKLRG